MVPGINFLSPGDLSVDMRHAVLSY